MKQLDARLSKLEAAQRLASPTVWPSYLCGEDEADIQRQLDDLQARGFVGKIHAYIGGVCPDDWDNVEP